MSLPWMPLDVPDYLADTAHLNAAQSGAYLHLIMHYWLSGGLPEDDAALARIGRMTTAEWRRAKPIVQAFFHHGWKHKRVDKELAKAADISSKRRASAQQKHSKSSASAPANAEQLDTHARTCAGALPEPLQRKEDPPDGGSAYAFETGVIRLTARDLDLWKASFSHLDVPAELIGMAEWAGTEKNWFLAVKGLLTKRNREAGIRIEAQRNGQILTPSGNPWPEGIT